MSQLQAKADRNRELITSGPIIKAILSLAVPVVAGMFMEIALAVANFFWVGWLGPAAQDAVTSSLVMVWTVFSLTAVVSIGVTALVSRHVGAGELEQAAHHGRQAFWLAGIIGGVVSAAGVVWSPQLLALMNVAEATRAQALPYLRIFFASSLLIFLCETTYAIFRASGDTRTPVKTGITVVAINICLDPLLIFGWGPFPELGVPGAAVATTLALATGAVLILRLLLLGRVGYSVGNPLRERVGVRSILKIAQIGAPIASQQFVFVLVYWFLIGFVHRFGENAGAAMGIGNRMESFSYLTCYGFSIAASTLVGQNLGAGRPERAARCAWGAVGLGVGLTLIFSALFIGFPGLITGVFTSDPEVRRIAIDYLIILGISQSAMALEIVLEGAFSGAGNTVPPMLVMLPGSLARIPLAWYLAFDQGWGINGIWWTLTITTTVKAVLLAWWFSLGRWKRKKL
ncbi:MAG: MATE family efflux transporter [Candidatus Zixiibacteriota bacterium]